VSQHERGTRQSIALALTFGLLAPSCLPDLDPARVAVLCRGGSPDGFLDPQEQCDDGNQQKGDGCDSSCQLECEAPAVLDEATRHCYLPLTGAGSAEEAAATCRSLGAALVTVRSAAEQDLLARTLLASASGPMLTAYRLNESSVVTATNPGGLEVHEAVPYPSILYAEPGILAVDPGAPGQCPGCFDGGLGAGWWQAGGALRIGLGPGGKFTAFDPGSGPVGAICERLPAGAPPNPCPGGPSCVGGATSQVQLGGRRYSYFASPASREDALARCADLGATLWIMRDEAERELVVRSLGLTATGTRTTWVGLRHGATGWASEGGAPLPSPLPWALEPTDAEAAAAPCAVLLTRSNSYALGLLLPAGCATLTDGAGSAFVCVGP
jgi:cysteine-rich repeat protein